MHIRLLFLFLLLAPVGASAGKPTIRPPYLKAGDTVGIVTPAGKLRPDADTVRVRERLESWGLHVLFAPHYDGQEELYFSAPDSERASDLQRMIDDPAVKAILCYKGGYGSVRLLPNVELDPLRRRPKWIVGFSDITMLHLALAKLGVESIHGPMPTTFSFDEQTPDASADSLRLALFGGLESVCTEPHPLDRFGVAEGVVAGGNLTLICSAMGTPEQLDARRPTILLIEEVGESVYRLDRMMQQLNRSGLLGQIKGVLVGHFTAIKDSENFGKVEDVLTRYLSPLGIPVVFGFPSGHERPNHPVFMGREATLEVDESGSRLRFR